MNQGFSSSQKIKEQRRQEEIYNEDNKLENREITES